MEPGLPYGDFGVMWNSDAKQPSDVTSLSQLFEPIIGSRPSICQLLVLHISTRN